mgnify:FL=1
MELKATRWEIEGSIATLFLSRPHRRNAWTGRMHTEFRFLLEKAELDPNIRVVIITGDGPDFCVGADSQALEGHAAKGGYDPGTDSSLPTPGYGVAKEFDQNFAFMMALNVTTVAAVNGAAAGVGLVAACYCDLRFAATDARITTAHGPLGLPAEYGLSWLLPRMIGLTRANDLLLSSRKFFASETEGWGLFNRIVEGSELDQTVREFTNEMVRHVAPSSLRMTKRQIYLDQHRDVGSSVAESDALLDAAMADPDYLEGVKALIEKRVPQW